MEKKSEAHEISFPIRSVNINTDPQLMEDVYSLTINRQIHRGLLRYTSELELVTDLAKSYQILDDGKRYRFILKESYFSDGSRITSSDVVNSFKRMLKVNAAIVSDLQSVIGFKKKSDLNFGVKVISPESVDFNLSFADPFFLKNLAAVDCAIVKVNKLGELESPVSGFYYIKSKNDSDIVLKLQNTPKDSQIDVLKFKKVEDDLNAIQMAQNGELDSLESVFVSKDIENQFILKGWSSFKSQIARILFISINPKKFELWERKILFKSLVQSNTLNSLDGYTKCYGMIPNLMAGNLNLNDLDKLNLSKIPEFLPKHRKIKFYLPENTETIKIAEFLKDVFLKLNLDVNLVYFSNEKYFETLREGKYDLILRSKYLDYPDGMAFLTYFKTGFSFNTFDTGTKKTDKMIALAQRESDKEARTKLYKDIQLELLNKFTLIPLLNGSNQSGLWSNKIKQVKAHPLGISSINFEEIELGTK